MSQAEEWAVDRFRRLRVEDPERFEMVPAVIATADVSDEVRRRAYERLALASAER